MSDYEFDEFEPNVRCFECGKRVKVFPASILVGRNLLEHVKIVRKLWGDAMTITTSFDFDREEMIEELENWVEDIQRMIKGYKPQVEKKKWWKIK